MEAFLKQGQSLLIAAGIAVGAVALGLAISALIMTILTSFARRSPSPFLQSLSRHVRLPLRLIFPIVSVSAVLPFLRLQPEVLQMFRHVLTVFLIGSVALLAAKLVHVTEEFILAHYHLDPTDNLEARKIYTQLQFFRKAAVIIIGVIAVALILMSFGRVRQVGTTILTSAGIIGIVIGLAAQRSISMFLGSLQLALTQPLRIDDVVIVDGEWGRVEEITLTYVVVRIWDLRRLVVPITYFIERPFQNWTRVSADLLGTVFLYVDYTVPVSAVREELHRILKESKWWDGKVWNLQVTNATERCVELRALMSASDASTAWDLRCHVRERLLEFIQARYPEALPRFRAEIRESPAEPGGGLRVPEAASPGPR